MDDRVREELDARITKLERETVRMRKGVVTGINPLDIDLGGSGVSIEGVPLVDGSQPAVNDAISTLVAGNQILALGSLGRLRWQAGKVESFAWSGSDLTTITVAHSLGVAPSIVIATPNNADSADARFPWAISAHTFTSSDFKLTMGTRNNSTIGAFSAAGPSWLAAVLAS